jgi:hypothetical protein
MNMCCHAIHSDFEPNQRFSNFDCAINVGCRQRGAKSILVAGSVSEYRLVLFKSFARCAHILNASPFQGLPSRARDYTAAQ